MKNQIVITLDKTGRLSPFAEAEKFVLYGKTGDGWQSNAVITVAHSLFQADGIRAAVKELLTRFADCRIILSKQINGIAYQVLNRHGYHIFESDSIGDLSGIVLEIEAAQNEAQAKLNVHLEPYSKNDDGCYFFNLIELQRERPEISSKKALRCFIEEQAFIELELICQHLPPWMEDVMMRRGLGYRIESIGADACRAVIYNEICR